MSDAEVPTAEYPIPTAPVPGVEPGPDAAASAGAGAVDDEDFGAGAAATPGGPDDGLGAGAGAGTGGAGPGLGDDDATQPTGPSGGATPAPTDSGDASGRPAATSVTGLAPTAACTTCGEPLVGGAKFCEACGTPTGAVDVATSPGPADEDTDGTSACVRCGAAVGDDGYCTMCGHRALEPVTVDDRGATAYATHRGRRHDRNEDAAALATTSEGFPVLVVSDGVSISPNPHKASAAAVTAAATRLAGRPFAGDQDLIDAVALAHEAASAVPPSGDPHWVEDGTHPACTIVVAVVSPTDVHLANVGDARGYLLTATTTAEAEATPGTEDAPPWSATQLTVDDSAAAEAVAGGIDPDLALEIEGGHAITAWLGADAPEVEVHLATHELGRDDLVCVCSDGLWNYATTDAAFGGLVSAHLPPPGTAPGPLGPPCEALVSWANGRGGADNITVTIGLVPGEGEADPVREASE